MMGACRIGTLDSQKLEVVMTAFQKQSGVATVARPVEDWSTSSARAEALAARLEEGAEALVELAKGLTEAEWQTRGSADRRKIGVVVHHVASMYPIEIELAQQLGRGEPVTGVTWDVVHEINVRHQEEQAKVTKEVAIELLERNSAAAAAAIRELTDAQLDTAASNSLYGGAPLTCQFMLEDHAVRHAYHHLAKIRQTLGA